MKNWKTTAVGAIGAVAVNVGPMLQGGTFNLKDFLAGLALALIGFFAKDAGKTGEGF